MMMPRTPTSGFSLVELSIVLVILGLLVGGILAGQSLIHASELRSITREYQQHVAATQSFRDKYFQLPGDMNNATSFWGISAGTGSDNACRIHVSTDGKTCNGNGNYFISSWAGSDESFRFWQHLANAGLVEGFYIGTRDGTSSITASLRNSANAKYNQAVWWPYSHGIITTASPYLFAGTYDNVFEFVKPTANDQAQTPVLNPPDAWNIDSKVDDGKPATGIVRVRCMSGFTSCSTGTTGADTNASYKLDVTDINISLVFSRVY